MISIIKTALAFTKHGVNMAFINRLRYTDFVSNLPTNVPNTERN